MPTQRLYSIVAAAVTAASVAPAEPADLLTEEDWLVDHPVALSASRLAQTVADAPAAITIIDREMIEAAGVREIQELLRLAPGMLVHHDSSHLASVTYHAMADTYSRRMLVLIDGRTAYSPVISAVSWTMLPLTIDDIDRIEIIRGPNAAAFGSNAYLGVISITTRRPHLYSGADSHVMAGNYGTYRAHLSWGSGEGDLDWRATFQVSGDDGFNNLADEEDDKDTASLSWRADWRDAHGGRWEYHVGLAKGMRGLGREGHLTRPLHRIHAQNGHMQVRWLSGDDPNDNYALNAYWMTDAWDQVYTTPPIPQLGGLQGTWDLSVRGDRYEIEFQRTLAPYENIRSVWGVATRLDRMRAPGYLGTPEFQTKTLARLFTHHEVRISPALLGNAGVMFEHDRNAGTEFSPRLALNWAFRPGQVLRVSWSEATRTPTIIEESADHFVDYGPLRDQMLMASGNLLSERIRSHEIGWMYQNPIRDLAFDIRAFHDRADRLITYFFVPADDIDGVAQDFRNFDELRMRGAELQARWRPTPDSRIVLNYMYQLLDATDVDELYSRSGPKHLASAFYQHRFTPATSGSVTWYHIGEMQGMNTGHLIERAQRIDLKLVHKFDWGGTPANLSLTVQEPLGTYHEFRLRNVIERRWFAQLGVRF